MMSDSNDLSFFWGLVSGAIVGGVAAALLIPRSGADTRERVAEQGVELKSRAADTVTRAQQRADEAIANVQETAHTIVNPVTSKDTSASSGV